MLGSYLDSIHSFQLIDSDNSTREQPEDQLEDENAATEELKKENLNKTERGDNAGLVEKAKLDERQESESREKLMKNVKKLLQNRTVLKDTQIVNTKTCAECDKTYL